MGQTTIKTTGIFDINNIEYFTHDKQKDIFNIDIYDFHIWINMDIGL